MTGIVLKDTRIYVHVLPLTETSGACVVSNKGKGAPDLCLIRFSTRCLVVHISGGLFPSRPAERMPDFTRLAPSGPGRMWLAWHAAKSSPMTGSRCGSVSLSPRG